MTRVVLTMMVRDEVDLVAAVVEHHLAQGFDHLVVTDNASIDGTREVLAEYARVAPVTVLDDPEHRKQQGTVVTSMARRARTELGADWVVNGDADEFVLATDGTSRAADVIRSWPVRLGCLQVPVRNLVGPIARSGSGLLTRMLWRDERDAESLVAAGVLAHPTPNAVHRGDPSIVVTQGNHAVSIPPSPLPEGLGEVEVLHVPWRSWSQFERKTVNAGRGYEANPLLRPSPNHHGMRDWRRWQEGTLLEAFRDRMTLPDPEGEPGLVRDERLADALRAIAPVLPALLAGAIDAALDEPFDAPILASGSTSS